MFGIEIDPRERVCQVKHKSFQWGSKYARGLDVLNTCGEEFFKFKGHNNK